MTNRCRFLIPRDDLFAATTIERLMSFLTRLGVPVSDFEDHSMVIGRDVYFVATFPSFTAAQHFHDLNREVIGAPYPL